MKLFEQERLAFFRTHFNLKWNPFPEIGVPETAVNDMAQVRKDAVQQIGQWIHYAQRYLQKSILFVKGQYGSGKSFLLRKMVSEVSVAFAGKGELKPKRIYLDKPSVEAQAFTKAIMETLGLDNIRKMTWAVIKNELAADLAKPPNELRQHALTESKVPLDKLFDLNENEDYRKFLHEFDGFKQNRRQLRNYFVNLLSRGLTILECPSVLVDFLLAYETSQAWQTLLNIKLPRRDRARFLRQLIQDMITLLKSDGTIYLFVIIDEFQQITEKGFNSTKEQAEYAYTMMEILNPIETGLGLIISITEQDFQKIRTITPFVNQLSMQIELPPLQEGEIVELTRFYLAQARVAAENTQRTDIFPFKPEVMATTTQKLRPIGLSTTPRNVVQFFHHLLQYCFKKRIATIDKNVVNDFMHYSG